MNIVHRLPEAERCNAVQQLLELLMNLHARGWKIEGDRVVLGDGPYHEHSQEIH